MMNVARRTQSPPGAMALGTGGEEIGWIHDDTITVSGYRDLTTAAHAAWVAYQAIARRLARRRDGGNALPDIPEVSGLTLADAQGYQVLIGNGQQVARIRVDDSTRAEATFSVEVRVPQPTNPIMMNGLAYRMLRSLAGLGLLPESARLPSASQSIQALASAA